MNRLKQTSAPFVRTVTCPGRYGYGREPWSEPDGQTHPNQGTALEDLGSKDSEPESKGPPYATKRVAAYRDLREIVNQQPPYTSELCQIAIGAASYTKLCVLRYATI